MEQRSSKSWAFPKQVRLKRKSVNCDISAQWIDSSIKSSEPVCVKRYRRQMCNSNLRTSAPISKCDDDQSAVVSPTSSPEDEYFTHSGHELLTIESSEQCAQSATLDLIPDHISDSCSLPASQNSGENVEGGCTIAGVALPFTAEGQPEPSKDTSTIEFLNQIQHDASEAPYVSLFGKATREVQSRDSRGLVNRLRTLQRRLNSERSIWLHRRESGAIETLENRKSQLFQIVSHHDARSTGLPGMVAFRAVMIESPPKSAELSATTVVSPIADYPNAVVLLPISGALHRQAPSSDMFTSYSAWSTTLLGDTAKPGELLRAFYPWSCIPSEGGSQPTLFHSYFWVERVRDRDSSVCLASLNPSNSVSSLSSPVSVACSCFLSGSKSNILTCCKRFRDTRDAYADQVEAVLPADLNSNSLFVMHSFRLWILKKIRSALLVQFYSGESGLLLLPYEQQQSNNPSSLARQMRGLVEPQSGGVYHAQNLLQLPITHLSKKFLAAMTRYRSHFERLLAPQFARKFSTFCGGSQNVTSVEFGLWDARTCQFRLIESNWIEQHSRAPYHNLLPALSRCQVIGSWILEIPEGSHLQLEELSRLRSSVASSENSSLILDLMDQATHIFYLWLRRSTTHTVLPCVCLRNAVLPQHLRQDLWSENTKRPVPSIPIPFGTVLRLDHVLVGHDFIIVDWFSDIRWNGEPSNPQTNDSNPNSQFRSHVRSTSVLVNSTAILQSLKPGDIVRFSGVISRVDTRRSHTWPVCASCHSSDLVVNHQDHHRSTVLRCQQCQRFLSQTEPQEQRFEVEVIVKLDTTETRGLPHPLSDPGPQVVLNLSTARLFHLLGLSARELAETPQINPKTMMYKRIDDVLALVLRSEDHSRSLPGADVRSSHKRVLIAELMDYCAS